jgi:hypothetical protein
MQRQDSDGQESRWECWSEKIRNWLRPARSLKRFLLDCFLWGRKWQRQQPAPSNVRQFRPELEALIDRVCPGQPNGPLSHVLMGTGVLFVGQAMTAQSSAQAAPS